MCASGFRWLIYSCSTRPQVSTIILESLPFCYFLLVAGAQAPAPVLSFSPCAGRCPSFIPLSLLRDLIVPRHSFSDCCAALHNFWQHKPLQQFSNSLILHRVSRLHLTIPQHEDYNPGRCVWRCRHSCGLPCLHRPVATSLCSRHPRLQWQLQVWYLRH
jgi:hypothetical protein